MKQKFTPRVYYFKESTGSGVSDGPTKMPPMPSQDQLQGILRQHMQNQEQQRMRTLNEAGEKAALILSALVSEGGGVEKFLRDGNIYKAISDGWMSDKVTPELVKQFKERIILPIYQKQGWNFRPDDIGITFTGPQINGLPSMKILAKGTEASLGVTVGNIITPLPSILGFATVPPTVQSVIAPVNTLAQRPAESGPNLSFFNLPPEQNSGGDGLSGVVNFFKDGYANSGREGLRTANILNNITTIARLWNTQQLSPEQRNLFAKALISGQRLGGNGYQAIDQIQPQGDGFSIMVRKTSLSQADMLEKNNLMGILYSQSKRPTVEMQMNLSNQIRLIDQRVGQQAQVYINAQNWRNVL